MTINFELDENNELTDLEIKDIKEKISRTEERIVKSFSLYFDFLTKQEDAGNYVEVHLPIFEFDITLMISKINKKFLISVLNQWNSVIYGNLILDDYPCISINDLKKFGKWSIYNDKKSLRIFKPL